MAEICHVCGRRFPNKVYRHPRADPNDKSPMLRTRLSVMCEGSPAKKERKSNAQPVCS